MTPKDPCFEPAPARGRAPDGADRAGRGGLSRWAPLLADADFWRGPPLDPEARAGHKEWHHFVVFGPDWTLLLNFSVDGTGAGRVLTILHHGAFHGHVARCGRPGLGIGTIDATFDRAGMRFRGGRYEIWHHGEGVRMEVVLTPVSAPSLSHHIRLGPGAHLSWCLVPRLFASGYHEVGGRRCQFEGRLAYHDHNWGRFRWGGDFSWEWGCAMPEDPASPWTAVFARMNDRARARTTATSVFLLKNGEHVRYFRDAEAAFSTEGASPSAPAWRLPAAAALLLPDQDRDVPAMTRFEARRGADHLSGQIEAGVRGQILMPSETDLRRVVRLNEVLARVQIRGHCAGEPVELCGPGLLEVVCG